MPEISRFLGIVIAMFHKDHEPAHFHAFYGEHEITIRISDVQVTGSFPRRAQGHVLEWYRLHKAELEETWQLAKQRLPFRASRHWSNDGPSDRRAACT